MIEGVIHFADMPDQKPVLWRILWDGRTEVFEDGKWQEPKPDANGWKFSATIRFEDGQL